MVGKNWIEVTKEHILLSTRSIEADIYNARLKMETVQKSIRKSPTVAEYKKSMNKLAFT